MKVQFSLVGFEEGHSWLPQPVDLDILPRVDEVVEIPGMPEGQVHVRTIVHYPLGDGDLKKGPFVYIVLGPKRSY